MFSRSTAIGVEYKSGILEALYNEEGRVTKNGLAWQFEYTLSDHLGNARVSFTDANNDGSIDTNATTSDEILQTQSYYPFGLTHSDTGNVQVGSANLYQYNGKEVEVEISSINYDWRMLDPTTGRWNVMDGASETYASLSPYGFVGNNPINNVEIDGNIFTSRSWSYFNGYDAEIRELKNELNNDELTDRQREKKQKKIEKLQGEINGKLEVLSEIGELDRSDQIYDVFSDNSMDESGPIRGMGVDVSATSFNFSTGVVELRISSKKSFAHELKHAYQFEKGLISLGSIESRTGAAFLLDKTDEVEAYQRSLLFGGKSYALDKLPERYSSLPTGPIDTSNHPSLDFLKVKKLSPAVINSNLQKVVNYYKLAFRVNGVTYFKQKK